MEVGRELKGVQLIDKLFSVEEFKCKLDGGPGTLTPVLYTVLLPSPPHIDSKLSSSPVKRHFFVHFPGPYLPNEVPQKQCSAFCRPAYL